MWSALILLRQNVIDFRHLHEMIAEQIFSESDFKKERKQSDLCLKRNAYPTKN